MVSFNFQTQSRPVQYHTVVVKHVAAQQNIRLVAAGDAPDDSRRGVPQFQLNQEGGNPADATVKSADRRLVQGNQVLLFRDPSGDHRDVGAISKRAGNAETAIPRSGGRMVTCTKGAGGVICWL